MVTRLMIAILRFWAFRRKKAELNPQDMRRIVLVELTRLGDVVSMLPVLPLVARQFPHAEIILVIDESIAPLLNAISMRMTVRGIRNPLVFLGVARGFAAIRSPRPDMVLSMSPANRNAFLTLASGAQFKAGYLRYSGSLAPHRQEFPVETAGCSGRETMIYQEENIEERAVRVCQTLGLDTGHRENIVTILPEVVTTVRDRLIRESRLPSEPYIVVHPFSQWQYRTWGAENFVALAQKIVFDHGYHVVFIGAYGDSDRLRLMGGMKGWDEKMHHAFSGDLLESSIVILGGVLFIGNDSGPLHLASALGKTIIGLYGPASPELTAPRASRGTYIYKRLPCSPCDQRRCVRPSDPCMAQISIEEVRAAVLKHLIAVPRVSARAHA